MVTPAFFLVLFLVAVAIGAATYYLLRRASPASPLEGEVPVDRGAWAALASRGVEALQAFGGAGRSARCLTPLPAKDAPPGAPSLGGGPLREADLDPATLVGRSADAVLADLGAPDRTTPGDAWLSAADGAHYILRPGGGLVKLHVFGAVPSRIPVGEPYLRWSWDRLVRPGAPGSPTTWTLCLTAHAGSEGLVVAEVLTHPTGAHF